MAVRGLVTRCALSGLWWGLMIVPMIICDQQSGFGCASSDGKVRLVDLGNASGEQKTLASVAAGLLNRHGKSPSVIMTLLPADALWIASLRADGPMQHCSWVDVTVIELWQLALDTGAANSTVIYNPAEPWSLATVITLCGIHQALPVAKLTPPPLHTLSSFLAAALKGWTVALPWLGFLWQLMLGLIGPSRHDRTVDNNVMSLTRTRVALDTRGRWSDEYAATEWAFQYLFPVCNDTDQMVAIQTSNLMSQGLLADFIVSRQLFAFWLPGMCKAGSPAQQLFDHITAPAWHKGQLLTVLGYFPSQEVIAACTARHTEVTLVSDWSPNLSFLSRMPSISTLNQTAALLVPAYLPNKTYIAIISSDGDNMQGDAYIETADFACTLPWDFLAAFGGLSWMDYNNKRVRMDERQSICGNRSAVCPPVSWTISNRLTSFAPFVLQWHYRQAAKTGGKDSFLMGPSGYGFLHPSALSPSDPARQQMINLTLAASKALDIDAYVHWDDYDNASLDPSHKEAQPDVQDGTRLSRVDHVAQHVDSPRLLCQDVKTCRSAGSQGMPPRSAGWQNTLAMEAYIAQFNQTSIHTVFSPIMPYVRDWIGDVATFREVVRWTNAGPETLADQLFALPPGTLGYVYQLPDVNMQAVEQLGSLVRDSHVVLVDYRHLRMLAMEKLSEQHYYA